MKTIEERLEALEQSSLVAGISTKKVLTAQEAALYLGWSMSYLYKKTATKEIPHYCPMGKMLYFDREELEAWMKRNRVASSDEVISKVQTDIAFGRIGKKRR